MAPGRCERIALPPGPVRGTLATYTAARFESSAVAVMAPQCTARFDSSVPHSRQSTKICESEYLTLPKDPEGPVVGWFVEVPRSLRDKFDELYPGRRHKKILTITAIQRAIDLHPKSLYNLYKEPPSDMESAQQHEEGSSTGTPRGEKDGTLD